MEKRTSLSLAKGSKVLALLVAGSLVFSSAHEVSPSPNQAGKWPVEKKTKGQPLKAEANKDGDKEKKPEEKKRFADEKSFNDVVKDMEEVKGLFTFHRKVDENKIYLEILPEQFDKIFLFSGSIEQSTGEKGFYSAQMGGSFPFYFRLVGKTVQLVVKNTTFTAEKNTPAERATQRSFADSILASARILSQPHNERKSLVVSLSDLLINDIPGLANALKETYKPSDYRFDRGNSAIGKIKSFPENSLVEVWLHFVSDNPRGGSLTLPDARSIPILVKYDLSALKDTGYKARLADDRVGHFLTLNQDFTSDKPTTPYVRRIHRWHLEKADPAAKLSEPKKPIVFWLENTIPVEYRAPMTEGILLWNKAFEKIGFKNAVVVKQQPDDADWDAADTRYNTIRWFAGVDASFAIGPSRANPFTGEIYDADIGFSEGIVRSIRRFSDEYAGGVIPLGREVKRPRLAWDRQGAHLCELADGLADQAAFGCSLLAARGVLSPEIEEKILRQFLVQVTAHEVGHTLGLRHNFRASTMLKPEELHNVEMTDEYSQSGSVMDYNPIVLAGKGEKQGHYLPTTLGPYDYWAIEYAYQPFEKNEPEELAKIASRTAEPHLAYSTDEDALGTFSASAIDPLVNQFDQSSDPLSYFMKRVELINELWQNMEARLLKQGEGYQVLRRALNRSTGEYNRALLTASKFIGGLYNYRHHAGDPNGLSPYAPIPAAKQRDAMEFMQKYAFSEEAFVLPPGLYNKLASERLPGLDGINGLFNATRIDYPWHDTVLNLQRGVLNRLFQPVTLSRLLDNELRFESQGDRFTMADMFIGLENSIWSELEKPLTEISSIRRNLQREHMKQLARLTTRSNGGAPEDATSLARATLVRLQEKLSLRLKEGTVKDATSLAHLEESHARIKSVLEAQLARAGE